MALPIGTIGSVIALGFVLFFNAGFSVRPLSNDASTTIETLSPAEVRGTMVALAIANVVHEDGLQRSREGAGPGRIAPPPNLRCDRSSLTVYNGRVLYLKRSRGRTRIRVRTDYDTTEDVTLRHRGTNDPSGLFLLNGKPFEPADWRKIETAKNHLRRGLRANVWVCRDGKVQPVVDWRPDETRQPTIEQSHIKGIFRDNGTCSRAINAIEIVCQTYTGYRYSSDFQSTIEHSRIPLLSHAFGLCLS
jgi:hypothetical protein